MGMTDLEWIRFTMAKMIVKDELGIEEARFAITPEAMLVDDLGADSLDLANIQAAVEDKGFEASDDAFHWGMTVGEVANLINLETEHAR